MSNYPWLKFWNEAPDDPKWIAVADLAGCTPQTAFYAFWKSAAYANEHDRKGGHITGLHPQVIASFCRVSLAEVGRIFQAFRELRMLIGERIANWAKRQTEKLVKPRSTGAERQARYLAKKAAAGAQGEFELGTVTPVTSALKASQAGVTSAADLEEEKDFISEANASERDPAIAEVVQIKNHRKEKDPVPGKRKSRIAADWEPDAQDREYAATKGFDHEWVERNAERFRDHHLKAGSCFVDWHAGWRTWVQRDNDFASRNSDERSVGDRSGPGSILAAFRRVRAAREAA